MAWASDDLGRRLVGDGTTCMGADGIEGDEVPGFLLNDDGRVTAVRVGEGGRPSDGHAGRTADGRPLGGARFAR